MVYRDISMEEAQKRHGEAGIVAPPPKPVVAKPIKKIIKVAKE